MIILRAVDLETTGLDPSDEVVEIGYCDLLDGKTGLATAGIVQSFVRPSRKIPAVASAVHHITDDVVNDAKPWADTWRILLETPNDGDDLVFVAHMASFERQFLDPLIKASWIDTWRCALRQWPDLDSHSLQAIRYALPLVADVGFASPPHRAAPDAYLCGLLALELLKHRTVETLITWSSEPPVFTKFDFGNRYKGQPLSAGDDGYLDWLANKEHSMGEDWRWNAKREIARRVGAEAAKAAADRQTYLELSLAALPGAASVRDLENWFLGQSDHWAKHGITVDSAEYRKIVAACSTRKKELQQAGEPQFEPSSAAT